MRATNSTHQYRTMPFTPVRNYLLDVMYGGEGGGWTSEQPVNNQRATSNEGIYQVFVRQVPSTLMCPGRSTAFAELPLSSCTAHTGSFTTTFALDPGSDSLHTRARTRQVPILHEIEGKEAISLRHNVILTTVHATAGHSEAHRCDHQVPNWTDNTVAEHLDDLLSSVRRTQTVRQQQQQREKSVSNSSLTWSHH